MLAAGTAATAEGTCLSYGFGNESLHFISYYLSLHWENSGKKKKKEGKGREGNRKGKGNEGKEKRRGEKSLIYFDLLFLDLQIWSELITGGAN